jgi:hypothetical protein
MSGTEKTIGQHDMKISDVLEDVAEKATASVSRAMHPLVERYAQILSGRPADANLLRPRASDSFSWVIGKHCKA